MEICITCDEHAHVFLRRWGAGVLAVPPAHLPGGGTEAAAGPAPRPADTASAKQAQHRRRGHTDPHTRFHVQEQSLTKLHQT